MGWIIVILALMIPLTAIVLDSDLGRALADYIRKRGSAGVEVGGGANNRRLAALETEVERLNAEVLRLEEETTFLHQLLESKPQMKPQLPPSSEPS